MREQIKGLPAILPLKTFVNVWAFFALFSLPSQKECVLFGSLLEDSLRRLGITITISNPEWEVYKRLEF